MGLDKCILLIQKKEYTHWNSCEKNVEMADKRIHIINRGCGWVHKKEGNQKASKKFKTKDEAIKIAPFKKKGYYIIIHKEDGQLKNGKSREINLNCIFDWKL